MSVGRLAKDQETYYLSEVIEGREDYYLDPGEAPGRWTGRLAGELRLAGVVEGDDLRAVLAGRDPRSGGALVRVTAWTLAYLVRIAADARSYASLAPEEYAVQLDAAERARALPALSVAPGGAPSANDITQVGRVGRPWRSVVQLAE